LRSAFKSSTLFARQSRGVFFPHHPKKQGRNSMTVQSRGRADRRKKLLAGAGVALALAAMPGASFAQEGKQTVCAIVPTTEIEYFATLLEEYKTAGEARNIEVTTIDSQNNPAREASSIEDCVSKKVNAIVASVIDPATSQASAKEAMDAGIPFILQGQEPTDVDWATGNVGYSEADMGRLAGEQVAECLKAKHGDAETIKVGACGWPQWPSTVRRIEASKKGGRGRHRQADPVGLRAGVRYSREGRSRRFPLRCRQTLTLRAVVSINDGSSLGAIAAFEAAGIDAGGALHAAPKQRSSEGRQYIRTRRSTGSVDLEPPGIAERQWTSVVQLGKGRGDPEDDLCRHDQGRQEQRLAVDAAITPLSAGRP
jgi:ABC-type sugar transport system substrate-binding protein